MCDSVWGSACAQSWGVADRHVYHHLDHRLRIAYRFIPSGSAGAYADELAAQAAKKAYGYIIRLFGHSVGLQTQKIADMAISHMVGFAGTPWTLMVHQSSVSASPVCSIHQNTKGYSMLGHVVYR